jgi:hypothetical protein
MRPLALLSRIRVTDTGAEKYRPDDLKNDVLDDSIWECHSVTEMTFLAPFEDITGTESGEMKLTRA